MIQQFVRQVHVLHNNMWQEECKEDCQLMAKVMMASQDPTSLCVHPNIPFGTLTTQAPGMVDLVPDTMAGWDQQQLHDQLKGQYGYCLSLQMQHVQSPALAQLLMEENPANHVNNKIHCGFARTTSARRSARASCACFQRGQFQQSNANTRRVLRTEPEAAPPQQQSLCPCRP
jgi:hypothetical protein